MTKIHSAVFGKKNTVMHVNWSTYPQVTVNAGFRRPFCLLNLKRYLTVGELRGVVARELGLSSNSVTLYAGSEGPNARRTPMADNQSPIETVLDEFEIPTISVAYLHPNGIRFPFSVMIGWTVHSRFRHAIISFVSWPWFDRLVLFVIIINTLALCLDEPVETEQTTLMTILEWQNVLTTTIFTFESAVKICALGVYSSPLSYFRDGWNWVDFVVVVTGWIAFSPPGAGKGGSSVQALRTLRVLRPLRSVKRVRGMRIVVESLLAALPQVFSVVLILGALILFYSILGSQVRPPIGPPSQAAAVLVRA